MSAMPEKPSLLRDQRGAVLLIAVFMSAFLVGILWYVIGIGDAAIYRQYMQDGADAVAFGSAVYHARGMNLIALINLVMAAVLMVLVAFKIGQLLLAAANIASCLIGAFLDPVCDLTTAAEEPYENLVMKVEKIVDTILKVLYQTSNAVAIGMPWVAEGKAIFVAQDYKPTVHGGAMISVSLIPGPVEKMLGNIVFHKKPAATTTAPSEVKPASTASEGGGEGGGGEGGGEESGKEGMRWGLPVQDDDYSVLCQHAGQNVAHLVFLPFKFLPGFGSLMGGVEKFTSGVVGTIVKTFPGYFCGDLKDAGKSIADTVKKTVTDKSKSSIEDLCKKRKSDTDAENKKRAKDKLPPIPFDMAKCLDATGKAFGVLGSAGGPTMGANKTSKKVYDPAIIGDDYFAIWSFDWGNLDDQSHGAKGVSIAGWGTKADGASTFSKVGIAKAEFYYEPKPEDPKKWSKTLDDRIPGGTMFGHKAEGGLVDEAMWNMRWRARLRRLRLPTPVAGGWLASKVNKHLEVPIVGDLLKYPAEKLGEMLDDKVKELIGPLTEEIVVH